MEQPSLPPDTTKEEDTVTAGQRTVNLMWERTQAKIAVSVVMVNLIVNSALPIAVVSLRIDVSTNQLSVLTLCLQPVSLITGIIIGFYFSRTNHTKIGGVGLKESGR